LIPNLGLSGRYTRRWYTGQRSTKNLALGDNPGIYYDAFCITLPADSRLPGAGQPLCGFYDIQPAMRGIVENFVTHASHFGDWKQIYDGFTFSFNARLPNGGLVSGGPSTGRTKEDTCFVVNSPQELHFCEVSPPFQMMWKLMGVYPLPWGGVQVSGAFQSLPGAEILTDYVATNAEVAPSLGRPLSAGATSTITLPITRPGTMYGTRWSQLDFRTSKIFGVGRQTRLLLSFDLFNVFNSAGVLSVNNSYGPVWQNPVGLIAPRLARFSTQVTF
jgi:hypothetical protein